MTIDQAIDTVQYWASHAESQGLMGVVSIHAEQLRNLCDAFIVLSDEKLTEAELFMIYDSLRMSGQDKLADKIENFAKDRRKAGIVI